MVADGCAESLVGAMNARAVLDIDLIANTDKIDITSYDRVKPDAALITHDHVTNDGGIGCNETIITKLREFPFDRKNYWHRLFLNFKQGYSTRQIS
jgi:hypothetical protein